MIGLVFKYAIQYCLLYWPLNCLLYCLLPRVGLLLPIGPHVGLILPIELRNRSAMVGISDTLVSSEEQQTQRDLRNTSPLVGIFDTPFLPPQQKDGRNLGPAAHFVALYLDPVTDPEVSTLAL